MKFATVWSSGTLLVSPRPLLLTWAVPLPIAALGVAAHQDYSLAFPGRTTWLLAHWLESMEELLEEICSYSLIFLKNKWRFRTGNCHGWAHSGRWRLSLSSLFHIHLLITENTKNSHWHWTATCAGHLMYVISNLHHHSAVRHHRPRSQIGILSLRTSMICQIPHH